MATREVMKIICSIYLLILVSATFMLFVESQSNTFQMYVNHAVFGFGVLGLSWFYLEEKDFQRIVLEDCMDSSG